MKPSQLASRLRRIASAIDNSKNPNRNLVAKDIRRVLLAMGDSSKLCGFTVDTANVREFAPISQTNPNGIVDGDFILTSPSGKKVQVSGRSDSNSVDLIVKIDGVAFEHSGEDEDEPYLYQIDPEAFPEENLNHSEPLWAVMHAAAAQVSQS